MLRRTVVSIHNDKANVGKCFYKLYGNRDCDTSRKSSCKHFCKHFCKLSVISFALVLSACGSSTSELTTTINDTTPLVIPSQSTQTNRLPDSSAAIDGTESSLLSYNADGRIPAPKDLSATNLRSGFVSLQWTSSQGDENQQHSEGDTVSYYRVYRNGDLFVDALSPNVEDASAPVGEVVYSVEAVKLVTQPEYGYERSDLINLTVQVPSAKLEAANQRGSELEEQDYNSALISFKDCVTSQASESVQSLCVNTQGYAWPVQANGSAGELLHNTFSLAGDVMISVRNTDAQFGPIPGIPTWTVKNSNTGEEIQRDVTFDEAVLASGEGHVVNGVAVGDDGTVFISGTLYQSYLPRTLAPSADVLPVTNAYYIAQFDYTSGEQLQFKRVSLSESPGALASVKHGLLELHQAGKVSWYSAQSLTEYTRVEVTGYPAFSDDQFVYTQSFDPSAYYRFSR